MKTDEILCEFELCINNMEKRCRLKNISVSEIGVCKESKLSDELEKIIRTQLDNLIEEE